MNTDVLDYPSEGTLNQLSHRATKLPTLVAVLVMIPNIIFWLVIGVKNAGFEALPYPILYFSSRLEDLLSLPVCLEGWIFLFAMGVYVLDPIRVRRYRIKLLISLLVFIVINIYCVFDYMFVGSKKFETVASMSNQNNSYHLTLMDENYCNNPPCTIDYYYRLYQCDKADVSCQILFTSENYQRWLGDPNKSASLGQSSQNTIQVIVDNQILYTHGSLP